MFVVCVDDGFCAATAAVRLQAELAEGALCANAAPERPMPSASEAEKINRDIISSRISLSRCASFTYVWQPVG